MRTFTFPVEVEAHPFAIGEFVVNQHKLVFPPLCVYCCQPSEDTVHEHIRGQKVISVEKHAYTGGAKTTTYVNVSQEIDIPYCAKHKKELAESGNRLYIILGISIVAGVLTWLTYAILYRWRVGVPIPASLLRTISLQMHLLAPMENRVIKNDTLAPGAAL